MTAVCALLLLARPAGAGTLTLTWNLNTEPEVTGYIVYIGTQPGLYAQAVDVHNVSTYAFSSATPGVRYYFAVAAYAGSLVSPLSLEVSGVSPAPGGNIPPTLTNPGATTSNVGQSIMLQLLGADANIDPLQYSASGLPPGLLLLASLGRISGTPTTTGTYAVTVSVSDGQSSASQSFLWTILTTGGSGSGSTQPGSTQPGSTQTGSTQTSTQTSATQRVDPILTHRASTNSVFTGTAAAVRPPAPPEPVRATAVRSPNGAGVGTRASNATGAAVPAVDYSGRPALTRSVAANPDERSGSATYSGSTAMVRPGSGDGSTGAVIVTGPTTHAAVRTPVEGTADASQPAPEEQLVQSAAAEPRRTAVSAPTTAPSVRIETPVAGATFAAGSAVIFAGIAQDAEDGSLSAEIVWRSSLDGSIGTGALLNKVLTPGVHTITASVTDSRGNTRSAQVTITVR
jgi:hypothetical protein